MAQALTDEEKARRDALRAELQAHRQEIASAIKKLLEREGLGQNELGRRLGKTSGAMSGWTGGRTQPSLEEFAYICRETKASADQLLGLKPSPERPLFNRRAAERALRQIAGARERNVAAEAALRAALLQSKGKRKRGK